MPDSEEQLDNLLDRWRRLAVAGIVLSADDLCQDCPELRSEVEQRINALRNDPQYVETRMPGELSEASSLPPADALDLPPTLGMTSRFEELTFYKRGGLGELFVAQDEALQRQVALKFIQEKHADNPETCSRFLSEAEITARLDHPGVVPVYGLGRTAEDRPYYAMRLIRGRTLDEALEEFHRRGPTDPGERAVAFQNLIRRFLSVCQTLAYAHNRGILHRDIKPQNIMLGRYGETLVVDWGLAMPIDRGDHARASGEETLTPESSDSAQSSGGAVGTPSYMSPEQAHGDIALTPAADIYSLGTTLYKLLTGVVPFAGRSSNEILERVKRGDYPHPRRLHHEIPRPLEAICMKAMALHPPERYATATELAADLERWLADEPVTAYQETVAERWIRFAKRHHTWAKAVGISLLALILVGVPAGLWFRSSLLERERIARELRANRLREAASYAAATFAAEIDLRWRILQRDAADPELRSLMSPDRTFDDRKEPLHAWLKARADYNGEFANADSWWVIAPDGVQQARQPPSQSTGRSYRFRTYFHGGDLDLSPEEATDVPIYREVHRSIVFESTSTRKPQITFSVPIWDSNERRNVLGRLAMTVQLGKFTSVNVGLGEGQSAVLVDLSRYKADREGVVLQHPAWEKELPGESSIDRLPTLDARTLEQLKAFRRRAVEQEGQGSLLLMYEDPVGGEYAGTWLAVCEPVFVKPRDSDKPMDTGLVVLVQTRP